MRAKAIQPLRFLAQSLMRTRVIFDLILSLFITQAKTHDTEGFERKK